MPAAAVIPAPRAYINVVAVKKPVVGFECRAFLKASGPTSVVWSFSDLRLRTETCGIVHGHRVIKLALLSFGGTTLQMCARRRHCE